MNSFDLVISSFINGFAHRSMRFDEFVTWLSGNNLLKGGVVIGIVWWLWFQNADIRRTREALMVAIIACFPALAVARVLSEWDEKLKADGVRFGLASSNVLFYVIGASQA